MLNKTTRPIIVSTCYGYCAGLEWDDVIDTCDRIIGISAIEIFYDNRQMNSIQVTYILAGGSAEVSAARHGDSAGSRVLIRLGDNKRIGGVAGTNVISHLTFTSENKCGNKTVHGPYGQSDGYILELKSSSDISVTV